MKEYLKCESCGFIIEKDKLGENCPACGVSKKLFEPYKVQISEKRKKILDFHIHSMLVHFPEAFIVFILILNLISLILPSGILLNLAYSSISVLSFSLPFFVIFAMLSGMLDGKVRYKRITTPLLKKKIIIGTSFLTSSVILAIFGVYISMISWSLVAILILSIISLSFGGYNSYLGGSLRCATMK
jgi:uncharacterized membrane protein